MLGKEFRQWANKCDADGLTDYYGIQAAVARSIVIDGEAFVQIIEGDSGPLLRLLPSEMIDSTMSGPINGRNVIGGIEFDSNGRRTAYHVFTAPPDGSMGLTTNTVRVPAEDMLHIFVPSGPGAVRGVSWLASVLLRLGELDQLEDALLVGAKVAAMHAGFLIDLNNSGSIPFDGKQAGSILQSGLEPGTLKVIPGGFDVRFSTPQQASQSVEFAQMQLRAVAAGLGVPEHLLTGDLRQANYSSLRAALVSFRQAVERIQFHYLIPQLVRPVWARVITSAVLSGKIDAADFESASADYLSAEFYPPAMPWVDPAKDAEAVATQIASGLKSRRQAVAELGYAIEDLDDEIAADRTREASLKLSFGNKSVSTGVQNNAQSQQ